MTQGTCVPAAKPPRVRWCMEAVGTGTDQGFAATARTVPQVLGGPPGNGNRDAPSRQTETIRTSSTSKMGYASANRAAFSYLWQNYKENREDFLSWAASAHRYLDNRRLTRLYFSFRNSSTLQRICPAKEPKQGFCCCLSCCPSTRSIFPPCCRPRSLS